MEAKLPYQVMTEHAYRAAAGVNFSSLKNMSLSPSKYQYAEQHPRPSSQAQLLGTAIHAAVLTPDIFERDYAVCPKMDGRTKEGKAAKAAWAEANHGKISIDPEDFETVCRAYDRIASDPACAQYVTGGVAEASWFVEDPVTAILCKGRTDYWHPEKRVVVDIKTTECAHPSVFMYHIRKYRYHVQLAWYASLVEWRTGKPCDGAIILAIEKGGDGDAQPYVVAGREFEAGVKICMEWLQKFSDCKEANAWPGYERKLIPVNFPDYYLDHIEDEGEEA